MDLSEKFAVLETALADLEDGPEGSESRVDLLVELGWEIGLHDPQRSRELSAEALQMATELGYELVYHNKLGNNAFFVDASYFERFGIEDNSPAKLFQPPQTRQVLKLDRSPQGRNGVPFEPGNDVLTWDDVVIPKRFRFDR